MFVRKPAAAKVLVTLVAFLSLTHQQAFAASSTWSTASGNWSAPASWVGGVPNQNDNAKLAGTGLTYTFDPATAKVSKLFLQGDGGTLAIGGNFLTVLNGVQVLTGTSGLDNNQITINGGKLTSGGPFANAGTLTLGTNVAGTVGSTLNTNSLTNSGVDINGVDNARISLTGGSIPANKTTLNVTNDLTNFGSITAAANSQILVGGNYANGSSTPTPGSVPLLSLDASSIKVTGTFTNTAPLICGCNAETSLTNHSTLTSGAFDNSNGSLSITHASTGTVTDFKMNAAASLVVGANSSLTSTGTFGGLSGGTLSGDYSIQGKFQYAGPGVTTIGNPGDFGTVAIIGNGLITNDGTSNALYGVSTINGGLVAAGGAVLSMGGPVTNYGGLGVSSASINIFNSLTNYGTVQLAPGYTAGDTTGGSLYVGGNFNNHAIVNVVNGSVTIGIGGDPDLNNTGGAQFTQNSTLTVHGNVNNTAGAVLSFTQSTANIDGFVNNNASQLTLTNSSTLTTGGDFNNSNGAVLDTHGSLLSVGGSLISDSSTVTLSGPTTCGDGCQPNATITGSVTNTNTSFTTNQGGVFNVGQGFSNDKNSTLTMDGGATLNINGALNNDGKVVITSNTSSNTASGNFLTAGSINNTGTFKVAGADGNVINNNQPAGGNTVNVTNAFKNSSADSVLTIGGGVNGGAGAAVTASFVMNSGAITVNGAQDLQSTRGSLESLGNFKNDIGATITVNSGVGIEFGEGGIVGALSNFRNLGTITLNGGAAALNGGAALFVGATFTNDNTGSLAINGGANGGGGGIAAVGNFDNYGAVTIAAAGLGSDSLEGVLLAGSFGEQGPIGGTYTQYRSTSSTTVDGLLQATQVNIEAGDLIVNGRVNSNVDVSGGTLSGGGVIQGNVTIDAGGTLAPGDPQHLDIIGDLDLSGLLDIELDNANNSDPMNQGYDTIQVDGDVTFGGTLDLDFTNTFTPFAGEDLTLLTYEGGTGHFASVNITGLDLSLWTVSEIYGNNSFQIEIDPSNLSATPEPASLLLLATGLAGVLSRRKHARREKR